MPEFKINPRDTTKVNFYDEVEVDVNRGGNFNVRIDGPEDRLKVGVDEPNIKFTIDNTKDNIYEFNLNLRRALNGDLMIFDHADIDIVILLEKKKIVAFAKDMMSEVVYGAENRLFGFLKKAGVVAFDSIQGGNVYGSLEGLILERKGDETPDSFSYVLYQISEWIKTERPYFEANEAHDEMMDDAILNPNDEYSTELGEVPHEEEKGSLKQRGLFAPYLYGKYTY